MVESPEGIGGRKWSLERWKLTSEPSLMQGTTALATLTPDGEKVMHLLVTAPQLWDAANALLKALTDNPGGMSVTESQAEAFIRLKNMVAKSVNKDRWEDVAQ